MNKSKLKAELKALYYETGSAGSYGGVERLFRSAIDKGLRLTRQDVIKFLKDQASYTLHKPARKHFPRNPTIAGCIDKQWQADLADMQAISKVNKGYRYILTIIDVFSKYAWAVVVKNKGSKEMVEAFKQILKKSYPRIPKKIQTDNGTEFTNKLVQNLFKNFGIHHFVSSSDKKAAVVERFNRTLKSRIWTYFTAQQTNRYFDKLDDFITSYNNSFHRSIGMKPAKVKKRHEPQIWRRLYGNMSMSSPKYMPGQKVRISKVKGTFDKGYIPNWSEEHFQIKRKIPMKRAVYELKDDLNEDIKGQFYEDEIQAIEKNRYLIEKVLKKRKDSKRNLEFFIKWKGWPAKFNSWISEKEFVKIR